MWPLVGKGVNQDLAFSAPCSECQLCSWFSISSLRDGLVATYALPSLSGGHGLFQLEASPGGLHRVWLAVSKSYSALMVMTLKISMEMGVGLERCPGWRSLGPG